MPIAAAAFAVAASAWAQDGAALKPVTITAPRATSPDVAGWGDIPLAKTPFQSTTLSNAALLDRGADRLADITRIDPSVSDAYNAEGYWDYLTVRGFVIDNRFNYRRDGLPINAETSIPLDNKERVEILKGTSGLQAGTSAPGGLVNLVVKRPTDAPLRSARLAWKQPGSVLGAVDLSQRFGEGQVFGVRINAAYEHLDPMVRNSRGNRSLFAFAGDWRITRDTLIEAEIESSRRSQPSQAAFSLLGNQVPAPVDPRLNLNNQPWSQPVVMSGRTESLRFTQKLAEGWSWTAHGATQRLRTDDRLAYPFGCTDTDRYYPDRFCPNGTYDLYDFRSENERRRQDSLEVALHGQSNTGTLKHVLSAGVLQGRVGNRFQGQAYNYVGTGNVAGTLVTPADPSLTDANTNRDEHSTELFARDAVHIDERLTAWLGVRHTRLHRASVRTDGSQASDYAQAITTPSIALSYVVSPALNAYASWGQGIESDLTPNRPRYVDPGAALPALKSRQVEVGLKGMSDHTTWGLAAYDIVRPATSDIGDCLDSQPGSCVHRVDGNARHRGLEATLGWEAGAWALDGGLQALRARRDGSVDTSINGKRPTNVPAFAVKLETRYRVAALPGLQLQANLLSESNRMVLADNSARIPGYGRIDLGARYERQYNATTTIWRAGVDNLLDRRAWRESPFQFGHAYLYPLAPRTFRASVEVSL